MPKEEKTPPAPPQPAADDARMQAWIELREQLRALDAQLETVKLLLRLQAGSGR